MTSQAAEQAVTQPGSTWQSWTIPLVAGFVFSTCAVALLVPPAAHSLTWPGVAAHSAVLLTLAAGVAVAGMWALHRIFDEYFGRRPASAVVACAWSAAIWLPLLLLLQTEHALWAMAVPLPITVIVTRFGKRQVTEATEPRPLTTVPAQLFHTVAALQPARIATTALLSAVLLQAAIAAFAGAAYATAESSIILLTAALVWGFSGDREGTHSARWRRGSVLPCFLLTCLALTPFLRSALQSGAIQHVVMAGVRAPIVPHIIRPALSYSGVILTAPPQAKRKMLESPPPSALSASATPRKETLIPFDGNYWFYELGEQRPGPDSPVERGDPTTRFIHTTHGLPLNMEAHQRLGNHVTAACCGSLAVDVRDADNRIGVIAVEAILTDLSAPGHPSRSLGSVPIRASQGTKISLYRAPIDERLRFPLRAARGFRFNQITLVFHPDRKRDLASSRVRIKDFALEP